MNKPTIFFSHSSKDKDLILSIKDRLIKYTGGVLEIFMSSDGQSIPFGTNWIHRIEEGLNNAKVMFVFVTENSISSGWIYFEAGFAYSKGIHVIPVGIGEDIGALKAPLNLLQGFNVSSVDSFNNFISIINREFDYNFAESFTANDYTDIISRSTLNTGIFVVFDEPIHSIEFKIFGECHNGVTGVRHVDLDRFFEKIVDYLNQNLIPHSCQYPYHESNMKCLAFKGIKIVYKKTITIERAGKTATRWGYMEISISPYNFEESFELYRNLNMLLDEDEIFYLYIRLNDLFSYVVSEVDCAALIANVPGRFSFAKDQVGLYECNRLNLKFSIFDNRRCDPTKDQGPDYVLSIQYDPQKNHASDIMELVSQLYELKLIYKKTGEQNNA